MILRLKWYKELSLILPARHPLEPNILSRTYVRKSLLSPPTDILRNSTIYRREDTHIDTWYPASNLRFLSRIIYLALFLFFPILPRSRQGHAHARGLLTYVLFPKTRRPSAAPFFSRARGGLIRPPERYYSAAHLYVRDFCFSSKRWFWSSAWFIGEVW